MEQVCFETELEYPQFPELSYNIHNFWSISGVAIISEAVSVLKMFSEGHPGSLIVRRHGKYARVERRQLEMSGDLVDCQA